MYLYSKNIKRDLIIYFFYFMKSLRGCNELEEARI